MSPVAVDSVVDLASLGALVVALGVAGYVLFRVGRHRAIGDRLRSRFVLGVPWGTVVVVAFVVLVYLVIQGARRYPGNPLVIPFRSWSYFYPTGMLVSSFGHSSTGHITSNLVSTVVFAPIAEYAWSHYPRRRGVQTFASPLTNPFVRIGVFVLGVLLVGLLNALFVPGPVIGFSGVVFAFGGFAVVTAPVAAVVGLVASEAVGLLYDAVQLPVFEATARPIFWSPRWAEIAVQGHAFGILIGVLLGVALLYRRESWPSPWKIWVAALLFAVSKSLWAIYWQSGPRSWVMFRGAGLALVVTLATLVTVAAAARNRTLVGRIDLSWREAGVGLLLAGTFAIGLAAVPYNAIDLGQDDLPDEGVEVRDYVVTYDEDIEDGYVSAVRVPYLRDAVSVETSGVIVASAERDAWLRVVQEGELAHDGVERVTVGGLGWRETVVANRTGWNVVDAGTTYRVSIRRDGGDPVPVFTAPPVTSPAVIDERQVRIESRDDGFTAVVSGNDSTLGETSIPPPADPVTIGGLTLNRTENQLFVERNGTRVRIARYEHRTGDPG